MPQPQEQLGGGFGPSGLWVEDKELRRPSSTSARPPSATSRAVAATATAAAAGLLVAEPLVCEVLERESLSTLTRTLTLTLILTLTLTLTLILTLTLALTLTLTLTSTLTLTPTLTLTRCSSASTSHRPPACAALWCSSCRCRTAS